MIFPFPSGMMQQVLGHRYFTSESLGTHAITGGPVSLLTTTQTPSAGNYVVFWSCDMAVSTTLDASVSPLVDGSVIDTQEFSANDAGDVYSFGGMHFFTADGASHSFGIQGTVNTGGTATFKNMRVSAILLGANDAKASVSSFSTTSTSLSNAASLTFTPPSNGNYVLIATFQTQEVGAGQMRVQLSDGTTTIDYWPWDIRSSLGLPGYLRMIPITGVSGTPVTVTLKLAAQTAGQSQQLLKMRLLALREDRFAHVYKTRLAADDSGTQTSFTAGLSQTFTPVAADHLTLAGIIGGGSSDAARDAWQYSDGGTIVSSNQRLPVLCQTDVPASVQGVVLSHRIAAYAASSRTQEIDRKAVNASTAYIKAGSMIATFDLTGI